MLYPKIQEFIQTLSTKEIAEERKVILQPLISFIKDKVDTKEEIRLNFICTHNSRRSHLSQVWAQVLAAHFNVPNVYCYSGGTEATAMFPMAAKTLVKSGLKIKTIAFGNNPIYSIKYDENSHPVIGFSKTYDDDFNPQVQFAAILTCSNADKGCPFIPGAEKRIPITFKDPKAFDNTPEQEEKYLERSIQIASELYYVYNCVVEKII